MCDVDKVYITELILNITELVTEINLANKHHAFMEHYGHTKEIDVRVCINGWEANKKWDFSHSIYYDSPNYDEQLIKVIRLLEYIKAL